MNELLSLLSLRVRKMVLKETAGLHTPADEIEDIVQHVLMAVWQTDLARYDVTRGEFASFLRRRVRWSCGDAFRKRKKHIALSLDNHDEGAKIEIEAMGQAPAELNAASKRERLLTLVPMAVESALDSMNDPAAKQTILRHDFDCKPLFEVANTLNIHPSNATRARKRGLRYLKQALHNEFRDAA